MKLYALKLFLIFLFFTGLFAAEKHCLWQVEGKTNKVFLLGSVHMLTRTQYPLPAVFDSVYSESETIIFEVNIDSAQSPAAAAMLLRQGLLAGSKTLKDVLSDSVFSKLKATLVRFGQPIEMYLKMKPWLVSLMLNQLQMTKLQFDPQLGLEFYFSAKAKHDNKPVKSLERLSEQVNMLEKLSDINPDHLVLETITEINSAETMLNELLRAWKTGNSSALDSLINIGLKEFPEIGEILLVKRNLNWLQKIEPLLSEPKNYLIVVGAGHLVGPKGLVQLLRQKGYVVKQR